MSSGALLASILFCLCVFVFLSSWTLGAYYAGRILSTKPQSGSRQIMSTPVRALGLLVWVLGIIFLFFKLSPWLVAIPTISFVIGCLRDPVVDRWRARQLDQKSEIEWNWTGWFICPSSANPPKRKTLVGFSLPNFDERSDYKIWAPRTIPRASAWPNRPTLIGKVHARLTFWGWGRPNFWFSYFYS